MAVRGIQLVAVKRKLYDEHNDFRECFFFRRVIANRSPMFGRILLARYGLAEYGLSAFWVGYATFLNESIRNSAGVDTMYYPTTSKRLCK